MPANGTAEVVLSPNVDSDPPVNTTMDLTKGSHDRPSSGPPLYANGTVKHPFYGCLEHHDHSQPDEKPALGRYRGLTMVDVAYTIKTNGNATGFYFLNIDGLAPEAWDSTEFRFAVGYNFTQANETGSYFPLPVRLSARMQPLGKERSQRMSMK